MYSYCPIYPCKMVHNLYFWQFKSFFVWTIFYRHQCTCKCRLESVTGKKWMGPYIANKSYRVFIVIKCIKNVLYSTQCSEPYYYNKWYWQKLKSSTSETERCIKLPMHISTALFISFLIFVFQQICLQQSPYGKLYQSWLKISTVILQNSFTLHPTCTN